jgi:hypothetical protein
MKRNPLLLILLLAAGCVSTRTVEKPAVPAPGAESLPKAPGAERDAGLAVSPEEMPEANLPPPEGQGTESERPAAMPVPPAITAFEALRQAARLAPAEVRLLTVGGRVPLLLYDLNRDRHPECFAVGVRDRALKPAELEALSQSSRLFDPAAQPVAFVLLVYANSQGSLRKPTVVELGPRRVFEALTRTPLSAGRAAPLAVTVSFLKPDGREQELLVFDGVNGAPRYRRSLVESLSQRSWLEDVDADGTLDILTRERAVEEGLGYETFLTWSRWNGKAFTDVQTRNVLRNLSAFLGSLREALLAGDRQRLAELATEGREAARLRGKGLDETEMLAAVLGLKAAGLKELPRVTEVVFPQIMEDPFIARDAAGMYFLLTYRLVDENGIAYLPAARLYMLSNPFGERQFAFRAVGD